MRTEGALSAATACSALGVSVCVHETPAPLNSMSVPTSDPSRPLRPPEMDDEDCERRRGECLDEMTDLEKQFHDLKDKYGGGGREGEKWGEGGGV